MGIDEKIILKPLKYKLPQNRYNRKNSLLLNKLNSLFIKYNEINFNLANKELQLTDWEKSVIKDWENAGTLTDLVKYYNHKIIKIEFVGERPTYDLTVRKYHNFCLDCGLVSKNSTGTGKSTVATYSLCYELYKLMCLKNPNRFYLGADETIWFLFFNVTLKMAEKTMWRKVPKSTTEKPLVYGKGNRNR